MAGWVRAFLGLKLQAGDRRAGARCAEPVLDLPAQHAHPALAWGRGYLYRQPFYQE